VLVAERTDIEPSWRITSDSLALWLAGRLGAKACYLIKSIARARHANASATQLARDGIVDEAFPSMLAETRVPATLLCRGDQAAFAAALSGTEPFGTAID
jgi:5-(aminomethyl)-3-furanmethanol phosphate kinase